MSEVPDSPPFSTVDINNESRDDEDLFASAVQVSRVLLESCFTMMLSRVRPL